MNAQINETILNKKLFIFLFAGTEEIPKKSVVNRVASQLQKALHEKGIAFLVNHGISEEKVNNFVYNFGTTILFNRLCFNYRLQLKMAWLHLDDFCKLPNDTKEMYIRKAPDNHGYVKPGQEKFDGMTPELRHAFNICTLNAATLPEEPLPGFKEDIAELASDFKHLSSLLLQAIAVGLGMFYFFLSLCICTSVHLYQ